MHRWQSYDTTWAEASDDEDDATWGPVLVHASTDRVAAPQVASDHVQRVDGAASACPAPKDASHPGADHMGRVADIQHQDEAVPTLEAQLQDGPQEAQHEATLEEARLYVAAPKLQEVVVLSQVSEPREWERACSLLSARQRLCEQASPGHPYACAYDVDVRSTWSQKHLHGGAFCSFRVSGALLVEALPSGLAAVVAAEENQPS